MDHISPINDTELLNTAKEIMKRAWAPYSGFKVGAALTARNDRGETAVFTGCNIETASFTPTICAERVAVSDAVKNGFTHIDKIAVCGGADGVISDFCPPCGVCRQVLSEFAAIDAVVILTNGKDIITYTVGELLPHAFSNPPKDK